MELIPEAALAAMQKSRLVDAVSWTLQANRGSLVLCVEFKTEDAGTQKSSAANRNDAKTRCNMKKGPKRKTPSQKRRDAARRAKWKKQKGVTVDRPVAPPRVAQPSDVIAGGSKLSERRPDDSTRMETDDIEPASGDSVDLPEVPAVVVEACGDRDVDSTPDVPAASFDVELDSFTPRTPDYQHIPVSPSSTSTNNNTSTATTHSEAEIAEIIADTQRFREEHRLQRMQQQKDFDRRMKVYEQEQTEREEEQAAVLQQTQQQQLQQTETQQRKKKKAKKKK